MPLASIDVTQVAALIAAATGLVAAIVGGVNLMLSIRRERPALAVFAREWAADRMGHERYIEVIATNVGHRPVTVVGIGLRLMGAEGRSWRLDDGKAQPPLPTKLEDGATVAMTWLREELGEAYWRGEANIYGSFAVDGRGNEVVGGPPGARQRQQERPQRARDAPE
jgi:hypothetical protein